MDFNFTILFLVILTLIFTIPAICFVGDSAKHPETLQAYIGLFSVYGFAMSHVIAERLIQMDRMAGPVFLFSDFKNFGWIHLIFVFFHISYVWWLGNHIKTNPRSFVALSKLRGFVNIQDEERCKKAPFFLFIILCIIYFGFAVETDEYNRTNSYQGSYSFLSICVKKTARRT